MSKIRLSLRVTEKEREMLAKRAEKDSRTITAYLLVSSELYEKHKYIANIRSNLTK